MSVEILAIYVAVGLVFSSFVSFEVGDVRGMSEETARMIAWVVIVLLWPIVMMKTTDGGDDV
jgi:hypothetical protein